MYDWVETPSGSLERLGDRDPAELQAGFRLVARDNLTSSRPPGSFPVRFEDSVFLPGRSYWKTGESGMQRLADARRLIASGKNLYYKRYFGDFPFVALNNAWGDTQSGGTFAGREEKVYVVQTNPRVLQRCLLMTTDPGDLVLDPTCGSGTTAYVAEQWGRRWITIDTSRVPLALTRQRLLTATYPWYDLRDASRGPSGGFVYKRRQNNKGEEVGGIVPHVTLKSIANDEPPAEEVLVDRPEIDKSVVRVTGPFCFEATIPAPVDLDHDGVDDAGALSESYGSHVERMLEVLRRSPVLRLEGNRTVSLQNVRPPARALSLSAEAMVGVNGDAKPAAIVFGPENGAVSERLVFEAAGEARLKGYSHLYVIGFAIEPNARELVAKAEQVAGVPATYVQATPDLLMGDLLKNMRSSQIFSVCGLPEIAARSVKKRDRADPDRYEVELLGVDTFDPATMDVTAIAPDDVPAWFLDTDYNGRCFRVTQAFFPKTEAWEGLRKALKADFEESVWGHLRGSVSAPFEARREQQIAVKVIDHRGNELMVVRALADALGGDGSGARA